MILLLVVCVSGLLAACGPSPTPTPPPPPCPTPPVTFGPPLNDNAVFMDPVVPNHSQAKAWQANDKQIVEPALTDVVNNKFGGPTGFGSLNVALIAFGVSPNEPIKLIRESVDSSGNPDVRAGVAKPYVTVYDSFFMVGPPLREALLGHEIAHYWDQAHEYALTADMRSWVQQGQEATGYGASAPVEDLPEVVRLYFWPQYGENMIWTDDAGVGLRMRLNGENPEGMPPFPWDRDRYDWLVNKFRGG